MKYRWFIPFALTLVFSAELFANTSAQETVIYEARYEGKLRGLNVDMRKKLIDKGNNHYHIQSRAENFLGEIKEDSHFLNFNGTLVPLDYRENRKLLGKRSDRSLTFNWKDKVAHFKRKDKPSKNREITLTDGILDPALYQLKLQQEAFTQKDKLGFQFAKQGRVKKMDFEKQSTRPYELNDKKYEAVNYRRVVNDGKKSTVVTLIPELDYIIAKIVHTEKDGSSYTIKLKELDYKAERLQTFYRSIKPLNENEQSKTEAP